MLMAGFEAGKSALLTKLIVQATKTTLDRMVRKFRFTVKRSAKVLVIPDPVGVLQEGEVQLVFGRDSPVDPSTMMRKAYLSGDVLVTRHPCLLPTDIRKVKASTHPSLSMYTDVIVFSTKGKSSLADLLSGGDMDGDTIRVFWEPSLVHHFTNAGIAESVSSIDIADAFFEDRETVAGLIRQCEDTNRDELLGNRLRGCLHAADSKGIYGKLHMCAAYMHGTGSREAIGMAFKFNNSMDGIKTGLQIRQEVLAADRKDYIRKMPEWEEPGAAHHHPYGELLPARRDSRLPICILDHLWTASEALVKELKGELLERQSSDFKRDEDLTHRWKEASEKCTITTIQRFAMVKHCEVVLEKHQKARMERGREQEIVRRERETRSVSPRKGARLMEATPYVRLADIRSYYESWSSKCISTSFTIAGLEVPSDSSTLLGDAIDEGEMDRLNRLLASCLYVQAWERRREDVAFDLAPSVLCSLKAEQVAKRLAANAPRNHQVAVVMPRHMAHALRPGRTLVSSAAAEQ